MLNDVNSHGEGRGCAHAHAQLISDCMTLTYVGYLVSTSCDLGKEFTSRIGYDMSTVQEAERVQIDKDVVKEALREILNEIPSFRAMAQGSRTGDDPPTDPASTGDGQTSQQSDKDTSSKLMYN